MSEEPRATDKTMTVGWNSSIGNEERDQHRQSLIRVWGGGKLKITQRWGLGTWVRGGTANPDKEVESYRKFGEKSLWFHIWLHKAGKRYGYPGSWAFEMGVLDKRPLVPSHGDLGIIQQTETEKLSSEWVKPQTMRG